MREEAEGRRIIPWPLSLFGNHTALNGSAISSMACPLTQPKCMRSITEVARPVQGWPVIVQGRSVGGWPYEACRLDNTTNTVRHRGRSGGRGSVFCMAPFDLR